MFSMAVASLGKATLIKALSGRFSVRVWIWLLQHNEPLGGFRGVSMRDDLGFKDGGDVRGISLNRAENAVVPTGALKNISWSERRHGS